MPPAGMEPRAPYGSRRSPLAQGGQDESVSLDVEQRLDNLEAEVASLRVNVHGPGQLWELTRDHAQRFDTLQTPLWKRVLFRVDGWPGQRNLNAGRPAWRPWRRWWTS